MTSTPPTPAISDERIAEIEAAAASVYSPYDFVPWPTLTKAEMQSIIARLRAAEARLSQATRYKADPECKNCGGSGLVYSVFTPGCRENCLCTLVPHVKGGGK